MAEGIRKRIGKKGAGYEASVYLKREGRKLRKTFPTLAAAKQWRADAQRQAARNALRTATKKTVNEAAEEFLAGIVDGSIRDRKEGIYKPSTVRTYQRQLEVEVLPRLGELRLDQVGKRDVRDFVKELRAKGLSDSSIKNALDPLRAIYRNAIADGEVEANPTADLKMPGRKKRRLDVVTPAQAAQLIEALPVGEQALWACAFYSGLRRGELRALRVEDVDLTRREIHVVRSWDDREGPVAPKSVAGNRVVPIVEQLRGYLADRILDNELVNVDLLFGRTATEPFAPTSVARRAGKAWDAAGLEPVTLHTARHTFASLLIDAGLTNVRAITEAMGHASATMTWDQYGHLFPQSRDEIRTKLECYLENATGAKTGASKSVTAAVGLVSGEEK